MGRGAAADGGPEERLWHRSAASATGMEARRAETPKEARCGARQPGPQRGVALLKRRVSTESRVSGSNWQAWPRNCIYLQF